MKYYALFILSSCIVAHANMVTRDVSIDGNTRELSITLKMEDLSMVGFAKTGANRARIYKDKSGQQWFVKDVDGAEKYLIRAYVASKVITYLYGDRFAESRLIGGHSIKIASKEIPDFSNFDELCRQGSLGACANDERAQINDVLLEGHEEVRSLIQFIGFTDAHEANRGAIKKDNAYVASMVDYDSAFAYKDMDSDICYLDPDLISRPMFPEDPLRMMQALRKIAALKDIEIDSIIYSATQDIKEVGIRADDEATRLYNKLIHSRNTIRTIIQNHKIIDAALENNFLLVRELIGDKDPYGVFTYNNESLKYISQQKCTREMQALIEELEDKNLDPFAKYCNKSVPIIEAAKYGDLKRMRILIEAGVDVNARGHDREIALTHAAERGHLEAVKLLIEAGADVNAINWNQIIYAANYDDNLEVMKLLLEAE